MRRAILILLATLMLSLPARGAEFRYSEVLAERPNMDEDFQRYIWDLAVARDLNEWETERYYSMLIGLAEGESDFHYSSKLTYHENGDGSVDRGMFQTNSCWTKTLKKLGYINSADDLYDKYVSARCGEWEWWQCYEKSGWSPESYSRYLYGLTRPDKAQNKWCQRVWTMQKNWYSILFPERQENSLQ